MSGRIHSEPCAACAGARVVAGEDCARCCASGEVDALADRDPRPLPGYAPERIAARLLGRLATARRSDAAHVAMTVARALDVDVPRSARDALEGAGVSGALLVELVELVASVAVEHAEVLAAERHRTARNAWIGEESYAERVLRAWSLAVRSTARAPRSTLEEVAIGAAVSPRTIGEAVRRAADSFASEEHGRRVVARRAELDELDDVALRRRHDSYHFEGGEFVAREVLIERIARQEVAHELTAELAPPPCALCGDEPGEGVCEGCGVAYQEPPPKRYRRHSSALDFSGESMMPTEEPPHD